MIPQVNLNGKDAVAEAPTSVQAPSATPLAGQTEAAAPHTLTAGERQGIAMGWVVIALGIFLLFGGLALWAASALGAGFGGWLISIAVLGVIMVAAIVAVSYFVIRPRR
jgi:hypothetical protein